MKYCSGICIKLFNIIKSSVLFCRHHCHLLIRFVILFIFCLLLLYSSSIHYYSFYCTNRFQQGLLEANKRNLWNTINGVRNKFMPILMPVCDRPHYLKRVLDGLAKVDGINETLVIISQDCALSSITSILSSIPSHIRTLILSHTPPYFSLPRYVDTNEYATSANVKFLLEFAFEYMLADGAILLESDLIPSVDFYRYHQWAYRNLLNVNNSKILSIHAFNLYSTNLSDPYTLFPRGFDSWGWSTARTRWPWFKNQWTKYKNWDSIVSRTAKQDEWICMLPKLSRTRMIGLKGINVNVYKESEKKRFEEDISLLTKAMTSSTTQNTLCVICGKVSGCFTCRECQKDFCKRHVVEHQQELSKHLDDLTLDHDQFRQSLTEQIQQPQHHSYIKQIDEWEQESINKIRQVANDARQQIQNLINQHTIELTESLTEIALELRKAREDDDFYETHLKQWKEKISRLKNVFAQIPNFSIRQENTNIISFIPKISLSKSSTETFGKSIGNIRIEDNGQVVVKDQPDGYATVRGNGEYASEQHRFRFKMEVNAMAGMEIIEFSSMEVISLDLMATEVT
ncbi:unnamed protein product [Rotaria sp. Silwood2]|nr:unnamed protein product [Rotaria sp. Silwood2]